MSDQVNQRKIEHILAIQKDEHIDRQGNWFDRIRLTHRALPELNLRDIDPSCRFLGKKLRFPLLISSMTGGDHEVVRRVNSNLALAAEHCQVAMGVGSQRVMFSQDKAVESFNLRPIAPNSVLLANIGAVQLNYGVGLEHLKAAIDVLEADGLILHLNPLQEAVQPEGDTNFSGLLQQIGDIQSELDIPVILKEVGSGLSVADVTAGLAQGIRFFDLAGAGGTSWSRIEYHRRIQAEDSLGLLFQDWGIPTPKALQLVEPLLDRATFIASGGIRNGIDMAKSVILGASVCGVAAPLLKPAMESADAVIATIERLYHEYVTTLFLLGIANTSSLYRNKSLIIEEL